MAATVLTVDEVPEALRRLREMDDAELDAICRRHGVRVLTVFGSAVDPEIDDPRDLDLGVVFEPHVAHDVHGLLEDLVALVGTERIDVLDAGRASETARMRAIAEGEPLYESERMAYAYAAMAAEGMYLETAPMRRAALESLG